MSHTARMHAGPSPCTPCQVVTKLPGVDDDPDLVCCSKKEQEELLRKVGGATNMGRPCSCMYERRWWDNHAVHMCVVWREKGNSLLAHGWC